MVRRQRQRCFCRGFLLSCLAAMGASFSVFPVLRPMAPPMARSSLVASIRCSLSLLAATPEEGSSESAAVVDDLQSPTVWKAFSVAWKLYQAAYQSKARKAGQVERIAFPPPNFVVPSLAPWPEQAQSMPLGRLVADLRADDSLLTAVQRAQWRAWTADPKGSANDDRKVSWRQVLQAYEVYQQQQQSSSVIPDPGYVMDDSGEWQGFRLGAYIQLVRKTVLRTNQTARKAFATVGIEPLQSDDGKQQQSSDGQQPSVNDVRFQNVYTALQIYKTVYDNLLVPQPFTVPAAEPWPQTVWGLRLGARVNAIRSQGTFVNGHPVRRRMLDELGFAWTTLATTTTASGSTSSAATETSTQINNFNEFNEEEEDDDTTDPASAPATGWNLEGAHMPETSLFDPSNLGGSGDSDNSMDAMNDNTVVDDEDDPDNLTPRTLADSLERASVQAMEVGIMEGWTEKNRRVIKGKRSKNIPWFNDDFGGDFVFDDVVEALQIYGNMYGDFANLTREDADFEVPVPEEVTGFLNGPMDDIFGAVEDDEDEVDSWFNNDNDDAEEEPQTTVTKGDLGDVPQSGNAWPESLAGMKLANIVRRIRDGSLEVRHLSERKKMLDQLEFDWGPDDHFIDVPFEKAMCAMYAYYLVRGDMFVPADFCMPNEDPWPEVLAGYELGATVHRIRELQNFFEAYHPEKVQLLRMIDFVWFADTLALPLDPNEPAEMSPETLLLSALGHPDYSKMTDIPMNMPDHIMADGPQSDDDDPKKWWRKWHNWDFVKDYWYQQGRRDNAYILRNMGYEQMAIEHEAKYGPGLYQRMNETLQAMDDGVNMDTLEERQYLLHTLTDYRSEMLGSTDLHPLEVDEMLVDLDNRVLELLKDDELATSFNEAAKEDENYNDGDEDEDLSVESKDDEELNTSSEEEQLDLEGELGL